ncbi:hypothetical protein [Janthinobacterium lividum]|uniref:Uncharacterized protein n=1 Tax=Janthinobacterium lividum TaxID=29581 RepID=A0ABU0XNC8_9BURK|nr:hypothetical protein [Janthinobacterium lividum]MDQ4625024.1 hypothetical protein [Janthinobacterium lividum]MDQ4673373.1 hypothetical protein [Janthinobacterium lividum]MDQ4684103.1 hypothetical protein [Janthinobacterium lividum]
MHTILQQPYHNTALLEHVNKILSAINVCKEKIEELLANEMSKDIIELEVINFFLLAKDLSISQKNLESANPTALKLAHKFIVQLGLFLIPHSNSEKPVRTNILNFVRETFTQAYPELSYIDLTKQNNFYQWLRKEGVGYKSTPSFGRYSSPDPRFPVTDSDLELFFQEERKMIFEKMVLELSPNNLANDPFHNNHDAVEYYEKYSYFLQFSAMNPTPCNPAQQQLPRDHDITK